MGFSLFLAGILDAEGGGVAQVEWKGRVGGRPVTTMPSVLFSSRNQRMCIPKDQEGGNRNV